MKITKSRLKQIIKEEMDSMAMAAMDPMTASSAEDLTELARKAGVIHGYLQALSESPDPGPVCDGVEEAVAAAYDSMIRNECEIG